MLEAVSTDDVIPLTSCIAEVNVLSCAFILPTSVWHVLNWAQSQLHHHHCHCCNHNHHHCLHGSSSGSDNSDEDDDDDEEQEQLELEGGGDGNDNNNKLYADLFGLKHTSSGDRLFKYFASSIFMLEMP